MDEIKNKLITKRGKLNNRWKYIYQNMSDVEKNLIDKKYSEYDCLLDKMKSVITGNYNLCKICNVIISHEKQTCCKNCSDLLIKQTNLEKYGVDNPSKSKDIQDKIKKTNLEKYGVDNPSKSKDIQDKIKKTNLEKYGADNPSKNHDIKEKIKQTNLEKYGSEYVQQNKEVREKSVKTLQENYGVTIPLQSEVIKNVKALTDYSIYGTSHHLKSDEIKNKIKTTSKNNKVKKLSNIIGIQCNVDKIPFNIKKVYSSEYITAITHYVLDGSKPSVDVLRNEFSQSRYNKLLHYYGYSNENKISSYEKSISIFLESLDINFEKNTRQVITPYELDFYLPDHKIAIEFNGLYWHSDLFKDKYYHQMKTKMCNELGITLIHIHEYLFGYKEDVYKSIIMAKLNKNQRIYARKCILKEVDKKEERDFLNKYHLQGFIGSSKCYGLYYNSELMSLCSFGKSRFNKNYNYELLRNCTKSGITVVGGLSKILKYYKTEIDNDNIICYNDASISYNKNNILTDPNYVWIKNDLVLTRYQTMKHKLPKLLGENFDEKLSESDNMRNNKYYRVYDSGNYITIL